MQEVYIGIGSNVGDRYANILHACRLMAKEFEIKKLSSVYETEPEGYENQPDFLNAVIKVHVNLEPGMLLKRLKEIEKEMGRRRSFWNAPRIIDLDILFYKGEVVKEPGLDIPHPHLHERAFVLVPLAEIAPDLIHPVLHKTTQELVDNLKSQRRVEKWGIINYGLNRRKDVSGIG